MNTENLNEILKFAINNELQAAKFYRELGEKVLTQAAKVMLKEFEQMELGHADILSSLDLQKIEKFIPQEVENMKLSDYMVEPEQHSQMSFQDIIVIAMKREEAAANMYNDLAAKTEDIALKNMFLKLASEESKHKLQLETIYDETINYEF